MAIYLPETTASTAESLTPRQIVVELDKSVIGQAQAKRAVAIALRNRTRRQKLPPDLASNRDHAQKAAEAAEQAVVVDLDTPVALASLGELARIGHELGDLAQKRK